MTIEQQGSNLADEPLEDRDPPRRAGDWTERLRTSRRAYVAAASVLTITFVVFSLALGHHRRHDPRIMLGDEPAHIDYALELSKGHLPAWGDHVNQTTLRVLSCANQHTLGSCRPGYRDPAYAGAAGYSYEAQQPPLGYIPYALASPSGGNPKQALLDLRRGGMIWTAATGAVLLVLALVEGLSLGALSIVLSVTLFCPQFFEWAATVTNDSAGAFAAGLALLAAALGRRWRESASFVLGIAVGGFIGLLKGLFVVVPVALVLEALFITRPSKRAPNRLRTLWRSGACAFGMVAGAAVAYVAFVLVQNERSTVSPHTVLRALLGYATTNHVHLKTIFDNLTGLPTVFVPLFAPVSSITSLYTIWSLALVGVLVGAIATQGPVGEGRSRALGLGILGAAVAMAVVWTFWWSLQGFDQATPARYAIPFLPLLGLLVARSTTATARWTIGLGLPMAAAIAQFAIQGY